MGKRWTVRGNDRPTLDPIFGLGATIAFWKAQLDRVLATSHAHTNDSSRHRVLATLVAAVVTQNDQSTGETVTLRARREAQGPEGLEGTALGISLESKGELEQSRHDVVMRFIGSHCFAVANSYGSRF